MAKFTFADFLVFADTGDVNEDTYVTIAKGVIGYLNEQYGVYPETATISRKYFLDANVTSFTPPVYPICDVHRIWYDGDILDDATYSYYGEDIEFDTAPTLADSRKPITLELDMGFEGVGVPDDLVMAVYRHILAVYYAIDKHTDNIEKVLNATGNTTVYRHDVIPLGSKRTYEFYAGHTLLRN